MFFSTGPQLLPTKLAKSQCIRSLLTTMLLMLFIYLKYLCWIIRNGYGHLDTSFSAKVMKAHKIVEIDTWTCTKVRNFK